ncbi:MAG TPA: hypothetical protein VGE96_00895 [Steroidobacteraceae bacterium]|jgi:DNA-binding transcriptional ArsR family regulator
MTRSETVLAALGDEPLNRHEIAAVTGLEDSAVSQELSRLRGEGRAERSPDGWIRGAGEPSQRVHRGWRVEPVDDEAKAKKRGRQSAAKRAASRPKKQRRKTRSEPAEEAAPSSEGIDFTYFGEFVVVRKRDVLALLETIERWRPLLEVARSR